MATEMLKLKERKDGYFETVWYDDAGDRHKKSFGRNKRDAKKRFSAFANEWTNDRRLRNPWLDAPDTIAAAWEQFAAHAETYYRRADGTPTGEARNLADAFGPVLDLYGDEAVATFSPLKLERVQNAMVESGLSLNTINARVRKVRQVFRWFARKEIVSPEVWHGLRAVDALKRGRCAAKNTQPVRPAPDAAVWAVCEHLPPTLRALIEVLYWSGMRPGEACIMRPVDLETSGTVWVYRPAHHKTLHLDKERIVALGPRAQAAIRPYLDRPLASYCFSPREAQRQRWDGCRTHRHQPVETPATGRRLAERYEPKALGNAIRRVCREHDIPHWSPAQLRHNAATRVRKAHGLEGAQVVLGHADADVTQIYAERNQTEAMRIMERVG